MPEPGTKEGIHIRVPNKRIDNYVVYELWSGENLVCAAYGGASLMTLGLMADRLSTPEAQSNPKSGAGSGFKYMINEDGTKLLHD